MDFCIPVCDGPTTIRKIRTYLEEEKVRQPFISILTAYTEAQFKAIGKDAGSDYYAVKPIFKKQLYRILVKAGLIV